jgi:ubiquinone/menaquinone biosynthesis C-methylase UbiE
MTAHVSPLEVRMSLPFAQLSFPEIFEQALVAPLFRPWAGPLLDDVKLTRGDRLLDIACGTGIVARVARERLGDAATVVGVDASAGMLGVARRVAPAIDWREGDAGALPLGDNERFDAVVCQQGLQFFPDRAAAAREMRRALEPGGRLAVSTWRPDDEIPFGRALRAVAERHVGPINDRRHSFGDSQALEALFRDAGFRGVRSKTISLPIRFEDGSVFARLNAVALVGMSDGAKALTDAERDALVSAITRESAEIVRRYSDANGLVFELSTNVLTAAV